MIPRFRETIAINLEEILGSELGPTKWFFS
jgi:hypothetical protein